MKKMRLVYLLLIFPTILFAQSKEIIGTVLDENNMPLPGASVLVKGLTIGASTDFDGAFSLNVPETGKTLVVSYLGYITKELVIGNKIGSVALIRKGCIFKRVSDFKKLERRKF